MHCQELPSRQMFRSSEDKVIWGVCGGIAAYFGVCSFWVRVAAIVMFFMFFPFSVIAYIVARMIMPMRMMPRVPDVLPPVPNVQREPFATASMSTLNSQFDRIEEQICRMEDVVTSREFVLRREFENLT